MSKEFQIKMRRRAAIEGTISELVRAHGLRRSRYRCSAKVQLQNFLIGTACNIRRWLNNSAKLDCSPNNPFSDLLSALAQFAHRVHKPFSQITLMRALIF